MFLEYIWVSLHIDHGPPQQQQPRAATLACLVARTDLADWQLVIWSRTISFFVNLTYSNYQRINVLYQPVNMNSPFWSSRGTLRVGGESKALLNLPFWEITVNLRNVLQLLVAEAFAKLKSISRRTRPSGIRSAVWSLCAIFNMFQASPLQFSLRSAQ
ncbi:hypothetical protein EI94DRAFT_257206 [Lactarius quietus]|nr:hypothetical protein EI94DRAFT_257206 [Lactarius quietus]